jgi:hypothetical protein
MVEVIVFNRVVATNIHPRGKARTYPTRMIQRHTMDLRFKHGVATVQAVVNDGTYKSQILKHLIIDGSTSKITIDRMMKESKSTFFYTTTSYKSKNLTSEKLDFLLDIPARDIKFWRAAFNHLYNRDALNEFIETRMISTKLF